MNDYEKIAKCISQTKKAHPKVSSKDIMEWCEKAIIYHPKLGPIDMLIFDLLRRAPKTKVSDLTSGQKSVYQGTIKQMRRKKWAKDPDYDPDFDFTGVADTAAHVIPITKLWKWWEPKGGEVGELKVVRLLVLRRDPYGKTTVYIRMQNPVGYDPSGNVEGELTVSNTRANNLLRYLIKEGIDIQ